MVMTLANAGGAAFMKIAPLDDQALLSHCINRRSKLQTDNNFKHVIMEKAYEYYHASKRYLAAKTKDQKGKTSLITSRPYQQVETLKSFMLSNRPKIFAEMEEQHKQVSDVALEFINKVMWGKDEIDYEEGMDSSEGFRLIMGTAIERVDWVREMGERLVPFSLGPIPTPFKKKEKFFTKNTPDVDIVNPLRFYPGNPYEQDIEKQKEMFEVIPMNLSDIMKNGQVKGLDGKPVYSNTKNLDRTMVEELTRDNDGPMRDYEDVSGIGINQDNQHESHDPVLRVEQWVFGADPGDIDRSPWIVTIIPDKIVLEKRRRKEGIPYVVKRFRLDSNLFWGIGIIEPNIPSYDEKNEYRNLRLNVRKRNYGLVLAFDEKKLVDKKDLVPKAAMTIRTLGDPQRAIQALSFNDNSAAMLQEEAMIDQDIERTGVPAILTGQEEVTDTASGQNLLQQTAASGFEKPRGRMEAGVERIAEKIAKLCAVHLIENREFYANDNGYLTKKFVDFSFFENEQGEALFRLKVELGSTKPIDEVTEQRKWMQFFQVTNGDPYWDQFKLRLFLGKKFAIPNTPELLNKVPMIPQQQAQQMAQEAFEKGKQERVKVEVAAWKLDETRKDLGDAEGVMEDGAEKLKQQIIQGKERDKREAAKN